MSSGAVSLQDAIDAIAAIRGPGWKTEIDPDARLVELGLDSLAAAELFLLLEEKAGRPLDPNSAGELERVADLTRLQPID